MKQKYIIYTLFFIFISFGTIAQEDNKNSTLQENTIEGLSVFPNPSTNGKLYVTTKLGLEKEVQIYDVLGKKVLETKTFYKEINISSLVVGVYIIKIKEKNIVVTRKLIVK